MSTSEVHPINAFCVDLEEWFHICGVETDYRDPATWDDAPSHVVHDTKVLMGLLDEVGAKGTFLTVGWVADRYPDLIRSLADNGHEIGCHSYHHETVFSQTPEQFETDLVRSLKILRDISGQAVTAYRAPSFSIKRECFWAYPILRRHGITVDVSIVPARRDEGGVEGFTRDPFRLRTSEGEIKCLPVSVMNIFGKTIPFSGGGYLRLFPLSLIKAGYRQNHRDGRPAMSYIHPREINPLQPRLKLPALKSFKYYVNIKGTESKLRKVLRTFRFSTVDEVVRHVDHWPEYELVDGNIQACESAATTGS